MSSCHGCTEKFGLLRKEYGCPKCKFSYCKKCLRFQILDPNTSKPVMVCMKCHQAVQSPVAKEPIDVMRALHRLESMDDPAKPPITVYRQPTTFGRLQELKQGLSLEDQQLLERLESLKKDDLGGAEPRNSNKRRSSEKVEEEIAERLARLKGEEYNPGAKTAAINFRNVKPETEQDIIAKFTNEVELDSKYDASVVSDIEERLARLRGEPGKASSSSAADPSVPMLPHSSGRGPVNPDADDELTEAEQVERILRQLKDELTIDAKAGFDSNEGSNVEPPESTDQQMEESDEDIDVDELCGICSEKRAVLLCKECDDDIFCKACFQELHRDLGEMHAAKPFQLKKH